jgi:hypothetical protein
MARRKEIEPLKKITLNVYARDWERMGILYPKVGPSAATRQLLRAHVMRVQAKAAAQTDDHLVQELDVDINLGDEA